MSAAFGQQDEPLQRLKSQLATSEAALRDARWSDLRRWYVNSQDQTMAVIPNPVEFLMSEKTGPRKVTLSHSFAVATHEVTVAQFQRFRSDHKHDGRYSPQPDCPVNAVSWYDAVAYCNWLSDQEELQRCYEPNDKGEYSEGMKIAADYLERTGYRLPTEKEWEFVCRAGTTSSFGFGEPVELLTKYVWYASNAESHMWPVGVKMPNSMGLCDMHGNAFEWCHNLHSPFAGQSDTVVRDSDARVSRGGAYHDSASFVRWDFRYNPVPPTFRNASVGFRLSRTYNLSP